MTTEQRYQTIERHFAHYQQALTQYAESDFSFKKTDKIWSLAQMYEHLFTSGLFFLKQIKACITESQPAKSEGEKTELGVKAFQYDSFPPIKIEIPEKWRGPEPEGKSIAYYQENLTSLLAKIKEYSQQVANYQGNHKTLHVVWGMLTAAEWFQVIEMHFRHHLRQQKDLEGFVLEKNEA